MKNGSIQDIYFDNLETGRDLSLGHDYGVLIRGAGGWVVQRVWVHRGGACFWCSGTDGAITDCRATESWADGINLNNGPTIDVDKAGLRLTAQNNYIIGSGDDGIAIMRRIAAVPLEIWLTLKCSQYFDRRILGKWACVLPVAEIQRCKTTSSPTQTIAMELELASLVPLAIPANQRSCRATR